MDIKILEQICWGGSKLAPIVDAALEQLGFDYDFEIVSSLPEIVEYGVSKTPALVVNGEIIFEGIVPSILEMPDILKKALEK